MNAVGGLIDSAAVRATLLTSASRERFVQLVQVNIRARIAAATVADCLTIRLLSGAQVVRTLRPSADLTYVKALTQFLRGKKFEGYVSDSQVTPITLAAIERSVAQFISDPTIVKQLRDTLIRDPSISQTISASVGDQLDAEREWLVAEATGGTPVAHVAGAAIDATTAAITAVASSAAGAKVGSVVAAVAGTAAGKIIVGKYLPVLVAHVVGTTAFKSAVAFLIKKVGVGVLVKTAVGKAILVALLGASLAGSIPVFWIIAPIIAGILIRDVLTLPRTLGEQVSESVAGDLRSKYEEIAGEIASAFSDAASAPVAVSAASKLGTS